MHMFAPSPRRAMTPPKAALPARWKRVVFALLILAVSGVGSSAAPTGDSDRQPAIEEIQPFLGTWLALGADCSDCGVEFTMYGGYPAPEFNLNTVEVKQIGKGVEVTFKFDDWQGSRHGSSQESTKDLRIEGSELHCLFNKEKGEVVLSRISPHELQVIVRQALKNINTARTDRYTDDPTLAKEAIARHPTASGLAQFLSGFASTPVYIPQTRIPPPATSGSSAGNPQSPSQYPNGQRTGSTYPQQQPQHPAQQMPASTAPQGQTAPVGPATTAKTSSSSYSDGTSATTTHPIAAAFYSTCVSIYEQSDGNVGLINHCTQDLNVHFCVANANYPMNNCGAGGGADAVSKGGFMWLAEYKNSGGGRIYWGACASPAYPMNWRQDGATYSFECQ